MWPNFHRRQWGFLLFFAHLANYSCYHQTRSAGLGILGPFFRLPIRKKLLSRRFSKLLIFNSLIEPLRPTQMASLNIEAPINSITVPSLKVSVFFTAHPQIETSDYLKKKNKKLKKFSLVHDVEIPLIVLAKFNIT
jgi:hypothetical protein